MSLLQHTPACTEAEAQRLALELYGLRATAAPLPSERDQNFLLETEGGERFVLKIANALEDRALLEAQSAAMNHLARRGVPGPRVVAVAGPPSIPPVQFTGGKKSGAPAQTDASSPFSFK